MPVGWNLIEIYSPDYPGERLVVCRNPYLAKERQRTRLDPVSATEKKLDELVKRVAAGKLVQEGKIGEALGRIANQYKVAKHFVFTVGLDSQTMEDIVRRECTFILCSNDLSISGETLLREYKTQNEVEKRFKVLKSPSYMNSVFLKTPHRVEALVYLLLICLMMLTVAERQVRKGLKENDDVILGIERRKIKQPTFWTILQIMDRVQYVSYISAGQMIRKLRSMDPCYRKIIDFLAIDESCFAWNGSG